MGDASYIFEKPWENIPEKQIQYASHEEAEKYFEEIEEIGNNKVPLDFKCRYITTTDYSKGKPLPLPIPEAIADAVETREDQRKLDTKKLNPVVQHDIGSKLDRGETTEIYVGDTVSGIKYPPISTTATSVPFTPMTITDPFAQRSEVISAFSKPRVSKKSCKVCFALSKMNLAERTAVQQAFEDTEEWTARAIFDTLTSLGIKVSYDAVKIHRRKEGIHNVFNN